MSVRVWQSRNGSDTWADWEMACPDHPDEHSTSPTWTWAMELAWGHIAMHHPREVVPCAHEWTSRSWIRPEVRRCLDCGIDLPLPGDS